MTRALIRRMGKLEQAMVPKAEAQTGRGHFIVVEPLEDPAAKIAALRASPEWEEGDQYVIWRVVDPHARERGLSRDR